MALPDDCKHLSSLPETEEGCQRMETRICALPDDLLLRFLHLLPTKDAVATSILSKRWRSVWKMMTRLAFIDQGSKRNGWFMKQSMQLHKAPKLVSLTIELGPPSPVDVDVGKCVESAVHRGVRWLDLNLLWRAEPRSFPKCLYTCDTLVELTLSNEILVDVSSSPARLPSLLFLTLDEVVYKDEDSLVKILSSSFVLKCLWVYRHEDDNLANFTVKVPSLETLIYTRRSTRRKDDEEEEEDFVVEDAEEEEEEYEVEDAEEVEGDDDLNGHAEEEEEEYDGSLVIDSPALTKLDLHDGWGDYCLIENMPCLDVAAIGVVCNPSDKVLRSLSSVIHLHLFLTKSMVACCNGVKYFRLMEFYFWPNNDVDWLDPLMLLLQNSPKLKSLTINTNPGHHPSSWNQPSSIAGCLSSHLEIFGWRGYGGGGDEKQLVTYVLANSKCLKTVEISFKASSNLEERRKEIESMPRISTSSRLLFPTQMKFRFKGKRSI